MNVILLCSLICLSSSSVFNQLAPLRKIKNKSLITIAPLKKMVNKQLIDVIMDHQKDPAYLLSVLSNVDPTQLNAVIVLIKALLAASESDLAALNLASTNANTAYTDATVAYDASVLAKAALVSAYGDANVLAEKHYTDANTVRETAYTAESAVRETAYTAESDVLDQQVNDLFVVQTEANGAKKNALGTLDTERIRLNGEIATLMQVIALLEGLGFSAPPTSSPTPATTSSPTPATTSSPTPASSELCVATDTQLVYNGFLYRTLQPAVIEGESRVDVSEQVWSSVPEGYEVVPDSDDIGTNVIAPHYWDAWRVCTMSKCYAGKHYKEHDNYCGSGQMCVKDTVQRWEVNLSGQYRIKPSSANYYRLLMRISCTG